MTIPINAPDIDHIFLFSSPDDIHQVVKQSGLKIVEEAYFAANNYDLKKALERKFPVLMVGILEKNERI
ncbi:hypothetical protein [Helicobacter sp. 'house sparrow 1']|uniref:hypothetical protein n=1 Tax=Helicobacter sp. 'house sparrow 1' TaxID=2020247 RepID=UPI001F16CA70